MNIKELSRTMTTGKAFTNFFFKQSEANGDQN